MEKSLINTPAEIILLILFLIGNLLNSPELFPDVSKDLSESVVVLLSATGFVIAIAIRIYAISLAKKALVLRDVTSPSQGIMTAIITCFAVSFLGAFYNPLSEEITWFGFIGGLAMLAALILEIIAAVKLLKISTINLILSGWCIIIRTISGIAGAIVFVYNEKIITDNKILVSLYFVIELLPVIGYFLIAESDDKASEEVTEN